MADCEAGEHSSEELLLLVLIGEVIAAHAGRHPGIVSEAIVEQIAATYVLTPREKRHREQRKNHAERIRRFSHEVFRVLAGAPDMEPGREIAARLLGSFLLTRRPCAALLRAERP